MTDEIYIECADESRDRPRRIHLTAFPALIGRQPGCEVQLSGSRISRRHAVIRRDDRGDLELRDLDSTNGTFVNGEQISEPTLVFDGDVIHVGESELRVVVERGHSGTTDDGFRTQIGLGPLSNRFPLTVREFNELMDQRLVTAHRQAIVDRDGNVAACELLARGTHPTLEPAPRDLFNLAETLDRQVDLSQLMRDRAFELAAASDFKGPWFFNIHPHELREPDQLLEGLRRLRESYPDLALVLEVHEAAVTDKSTIASIVAELRGMGIRLAYDDFGAGQARLQELVEVPPDYLKFDVSLVNGIQEAGSVRRTVLGRLNDMIRDLGIPTVAEGIEDAETAEACRDIGIDLLQGYHLGRPEPLE